MLDLKKEISEHKMTFIKPDINYLREENIRLKEKLEQADKIYEKDKKESIRKFYALKIRLERKRYKDKLHCIDSLIKDYEKILDENIKLKIMSEKLIKMECLEKFAYETNKMISCLNNLPEKRFEKKIQRPAEVTKAIEDLHNKLELSEKNIVKIKTFFTPIIELLEKDMSESSWLSEKNKQLLNNIQCSFKDLNINGPIYIKNYYFLLFEMDYYLKKIAQDINRNSIFKELFSIMLHGEKGTGGLKSAIERFGRLGVRDKLLEELEINNTRRLKNLNKKSFFEKHINPIFVPILNDFTRICLYSKVNFGDLNLTAKLQDDGLDINLLYELFKYIKIFLKNNFGLELKEINLFEDKFEGNEHVSYGRSALMLIYPDLQKQLHSLNKNIIYDIYSVGLDSTELGIHIKPKVLVKI